ncbi:hypothetical protein SAMN06265379_101337 [Saccharicrinis carchari]|uniref:Uncharacterized protein n=1 Tax=Saccharicrinis carchari TaxID=1168039 RepID=A0A521ARC6_SACCC|nr:hypothetical protein [Saccharicrinis carchari]SMO37336.1 hypothetical protein SAMN06265379_101337 [Saccharicrinis carchari]
MMYLINVSRRSLLSIVITLLLASCYSVRFMTTEGVPEPDPNNDCECYYRNMKVHELDTTITIGAIEKDFTLLLKNCESGSMAIVEYRSTLGGVLLSGITLGKKRRVKIKYVCNKTSN